jgi:hypothetical protein
MWSDLRQLSLPIALGKEEIPSELMVHPERRRGPKELRKAKGRIRRQIAASIDQTVHALKGNTNPFSQLGLGHS